MSRPARHSGCARRRAGWWWLATARRRLAFDRCAIGREHPWLIRAAPVSRVRIRRLGGGSHVHRPDRLVLAARPAPPGAFLPLDAADLRQRRAASRAPARAVGQERRSALGTLSRVHGGDLRRRVWKRLAAQPRDRGGAVALPEGPQRPRLRAARLRAVLVRLRVALRGARTRAAQARSPCAEIVPSYRTRRRCRRGAPSGDAGRSFSGGCSLTSPSTAASEGFALRIEGEEGSPGCRRWLV